jgi:hypothetical protein
LTAARFPAPSSVLAVPMRRTAFSDGTTEL